VSEREKGWNAFMMMCAWAKKKGDLRIEGVAIQLTTSYCDSLQMNTLIVCNMYVSGVFSSSENGKTHKM